MINMPSISLFNGFRDIELLMLELVGAYDEFSPFLSRKVLRTLWSWVYVMVDVD
jgi:hypothetical protein